MGCACKTKVKPSQEIGKESIENIEENSKVSRIFGYILRFFLFLIFLAALVPFILPLIIWMLFTTLVLNKKLDVFKIVYAIGKRLYKKEDEEEYYEDEVDDEDFNEDDYELYDKFEVTEIKNDEQ